MNLSELPLSIQTYYRRRGEEHLVVKVQGRITPSGESYTVQLSSGLRQTWHFTGGRGRRLWKIGRESYAGDTKRRGSSRHSY